MSLDDEKDPLSLDGSLPCTFLFERLVWYTCCFFFLFFFLFFMGWEHYPQRNFLRIGVLCASHCCLFKIRALSIFLHMFVCGCARLHCNVLLGGDHFNRYQERWILIMSITLCLCLRALFFTATFYLVQLLQWLLAIQKVRYLSSVWYKR